jgi:hypothetical protein
MEFSGPIMTGSAGTGAALQGGLRRFRVLVQQSFPTRRMTTRHRDPVTPLRRLANKVSAGVHHRKGAVW